jgi:two-component system nitrogen regulation sensor histidine kinase NtrY
VKFQADTSSRPASRLLLWLGVGAVVLLAGEAALRAAWPWLAAVTVAALILAIIAWLQQGPGERGLPISLALLAIASGVASGLIGHTVLHAGALQAEAIRSATLQRDRLLRSSIAGARHTANLALDRVGAKSPQAAPDLGDLVSNSDVETALAVIAGDTVIAVAGPHRMQPIMRDLPVALVSTPFARMLVIRETRDTRQAQVVLLLDSLPGLPVAGPSLAAACGDGVRWTWSSTLDGTVEFGTPEAAVTGIIAGMRPIATPVSALAAIWPRLLVGAGLVVLALIILLTASHPAVRAGAVLLPLWALARSDMGSPSLGPKGMRVLLAAAALLLLAIVLWRRPVRRTVVGLAASVLLLATAPPLIVLLTRDVVPKGQALSALTGFAWEAIIALAASGLLAVALAPLRAPGDEDAGAAWGLIATIASMVVGLIGIEAWTPLAHTAGWAPWYPPLWLLPIGLMLPLTTPRMRLISLATAAGVLASLATWSVSLDRRMELADADLRRLNAESDPTAAAALDSFAVAAREAHATRLDRLYAAWGASALAGRGVPTYLALWSASGQQREFVALDSLKVGWAELQEQVLLAGVEPRRFGLSRRVGHHEVLILPLAPDTIATVTIGPRSRIFAPTTFGLLVGWRSSSSDPPYTVVVPSDIGPVPDGQFRRAHRSVSEDVVVTAADPPRVVRATVEMLTSGPFLTRAALCVLVDVGLVLGAWLLLQRILGQQGTLAAPMLRHSHRRTVATALMAFFIVPAIVYTLISVVRLQRDARTQHEAELATTLRIVTGAGAIDVAEAPRPSTESLAFLADSANAEVGVYRQGRLIAASDSMLAELGLMPPIVGRAGVAPSSLSAGTLPSPLRGAALRLGMINATTPGTSLVVALPGGDSGLAREQVDQALVLLLSTLAGIAASVLVAGVIARALGRPIETLRRTAVAIGRHESPPPANDVPAEFVPVFGAITQMERDLRATEAELQAGRTRTAAILSTVATGVIGVDANGEVIHANPRAAELLGQEVTLGRRLAAQLPDGWERIVEGIDRLLGRDTRAPESRELQVGERRFAVTLAPLGDGGLVLAITDITEASRAARIVAWGEMARQVAHEIKNPLTPMRLGLQHLRRVRADASLDFPRLVDETAERLLTEIERLDRIARSFARYGAPPEHAMPMESIALKPVTAELASLFALGSEPMRVEVVGDVTGPVRARREELVQVLLNLLDNARQAGASSVRLALDGYTLRIEDDGRGIPADQLGRIFEPSFSTNTSGTGLGLAIVRRLVEGWEATIGVESGAGSGTVFTIRFLPGG